MKRAHSNARCRFDPLLLVNAAHPMPAGPLPDLVPVDDAHPEILLERRAAGLLRACIQAVGGRGRIVPVSGWRSQAEQQAIWDDTLRTEGEAFTRQYVARPGCSEHQTGLAIDLGLAADKIDFIRPAFPEDGVCGAFRRRAADFGLILRYPAGKEAVTGIAHEPWHFRYVGVPHARIMAEAGLTLEEYVARLRRDRRPLCRRFGPYAFTIQAWDGAPLPPVPAGGYRQVSADNCGGWIVTTWR